MTKPRVVLVVQGAGEGTHDDWDDKLVDSLRQHLGPAWEVRYPRMPAEDEPSYAAWRPAIVGAIADLDDGAVIVGHSVGGAITIQALAEERIRARLAAIVLIAAPFIGEGGWPDDEFELTDDLGARLAPAVAVHVFHGLADDEVPSAHADLFGRAIPGAYVHLLAGRDHQLDNDLAEVAEVIKGL